MLGSVAWRVVLGVVFGLVIGKALGITLASWFATRAGLAAKPVEVGWSALHGVAWLGGIGFTMSLFVADLAFGPGALLDSAKLGVLLASVIAGLTGYVLVRRHGLPSSARSMQAEDRLSFAGHLPETPSRP